MCGIIGVLGQAAEEQAAAGVAVMSHRGIRSSVSAGQGWAIGHVRLPIVGLGEDNDQPRDEGRWVIGFVGEVLDFRERRLGAECDLDLVCDTWWRDGPEGFRTFDGFWSVVAYDRIKNELHLLTDYLCQKPLYVRCDRWATAVASEPDALVALGPVVLDQVYLGAVCRWGYCPDLRRTPYIGIERIGPGEHWVLVEGEIESKQTVDKLQPIQSSQEGLKTEVEAAVKRRVCSADVPVAALVSGGLDSSIVYLLATRHQEVWAYHVENGERAACDLVAPNAIQLNCASVGAKQALNYMQEPLDLGSLLPQVALSDAVAASGGERVCLTGDGADELLGGYGRAVRYDSQAADVWLELVGWHLPRLDRVMMRNRIEVRSPFLARRVAGICLGFPRYARTNKAILREAFRDILPQSIVYGLKVPLRTGRVEQDRESWSIELVEAFKKRTEELCRRYQ